MRTTSLILIWYIVLKKFSLAVTIFHIKKPNSTVYSISVYVAMCSVEGGVINVVAAGPNRG